MAGLDRPGSGAGMYVNVAHGVRTVLRSPHEPKEKGAWRKQV